MKRQISILTIILTLAQPMAFASIPQSDKTIDWQASAPEGYDYKLLSKANIERYLPTDLTPTTNAYAFGTELQNKMGQRLADDLLNGDFFQKSSTGKMVQSLQQMTDKSVSFGEPAPGHTVHTFKFQVRAVERYAEMKYSGYFDSTVKYMPDNNTTDVSIIHNLDEQTVLSFTETNNLNTGAFNPNVSVTFKF